MTIHIPFAPPYISADEINAVVDVLKSDWLSMGYQTQNFEENFADYIGSKYAVATNSCTSALFLSLKTLGIRNGDEVITTPFTFAATANTIVHCGARPVFADIDEDTYNIDPTKIEEKITDKTKAIVIVHYGGKAADMRTISQLSMDYGIEIIEDAAHAAGSDYIGGTKVGSSGNLTCFSFYATKPMTTGEGGMITVNSDLLAERLKLLRLHGMSKDGWKRYIEQNNWYYDILDAGYKFNPSDITSAIGIQQLKKLEWMNDKRKQIAEFYGNELDDLELILPNTNDGLVSSYHLYPIRLLSYDRTEFMNQMGKRGICTSVHFIPLHLMTFYKKEFGYKLGDYPIAEKVFDNIVSLPIYPQLDIDCQKYIVASIKEILGSRVH